LWSPKSPFPSLKFCFFLAPSEYDGFFCPNLFPQKHFFLVFPGASCLLPSRPSTCYSVQRNSFSVQILNDLLACDFFSPLQTGSSVDELFSPPGSALLSLTAVCLIFFNPLSSGSSMIPLEETPFSSGPSFFRFLSHLWDSHPFTLSRFPSRRDV